MFERTERECVVDRGQDLPHQCPSLCVEWKEFSTPLLLKQEREREGLLYARMGFLVVCVHSVCLCVSLHICVYMWLLPLRKFHSLNNLGLEEGNLRAKFTINSKYTFT